jgi:hypothetical protein
VTSLRRSRAGAMALLFLFAHAGCAVTGTYEPRPSPHISKLDPGGRIFARGGRHFEPGLTADAEDLVSGNELAVAYARRAHHQMVAGLVLYAAGVATLATSLVLLGQTEDPAHNTAARVVLPLSLVPLFVSLGLVFTARGNVEDAVNIYNDGLYESGLDRQP